MMLRGENRSAATPPTRTSTARGRPAISSTAPRARPEPVIWRVSQASATKWNWSPRSEIVSPVNRSRKSRPASGRNMRPSPAGAAATA